MQFKLNEINQTLDTVALVDPDTLESIGSGSNPLKVEVTNGGAGVQLIATQYKVTSAFTGGAINDLIEQIQEFDTTSSPAVYVNTVWRNATQEQTLTSPPALDKITLLNTSASTVAVQDSVLPTGAATSALQTAANTLLAAIEAALGGNLQDGGSVEVSNLPVTQAVSAQALPLPQGAATLAKQDAANLILDAIKTAIDGLLKQGGTVQVGNFPATQVAHVDNFPATQAVTVDALPLPLGAAVAAKQSALAIDGGSMVHITNLPVTQPVSADALPLPAGAATSAKQDAATAEVTLIKDKMPVLRATSAAIVNDDPYSYSYTYTSGGDLATKTRSLNGVIQTITFTYNASGQLIGKSAWQ